MTKQIITISLDVEATGDSPETSSCIMMGFVAVLEGVDPDQEYYVVDKLQLCIEEQPGKTNDERCMEEFWSKNQELWDYIKKHEIPVQDAMERFAEWYTELLEDYDCWTFVMKPASYDWQWLNCLYDRYGPENKPKLPFSHRCLTSMQVAYSHMSGLTVQEIRERTACPDVAHTHYSDDDAHEQAYCYLKLVTLMQPKSTWMEWIVSIFANW